MRTKGNEDRMLSHFIRRSLGKLTLDEAAEDLWTELDQFKHMVDSEALEKLEGKSDVTIRVQEFYDHFKIEQSGRMSLILYYNSTIDELVRSKDEPAIRRNRRVSGEIEHIEKWRKTYGAIKEQFLEHQIPDGIIGAVHDHIHRIKKCNIDAFASIYNNPRALKQAYGFKRQVKRFIGDLYSTGLYFLSFGTLQMIRRSQEEVIQDLAGRFTKKITEKIDANVPTIADNVLNAYLHQRLYHNSISHAMPSEQKDL